VNLKRKIFQRNQTDKNCPQRKWDANGMLEWIKKKQTKTFIPKTQKLSSRKRLSPVPSVGLRKKKTHRKLRWKSSDGRSGRIPTFDEVEAWSDADFHRFGKNRRNNA